MCEACSDISRGLLKKEADDWEPSLTLLLGPDGVWNLGIRRQLGGSDPRTAPCHGRKKRLRKKKKKTPEKIEFLTPSLPQVTVLAEAPNSGRFRALFWENVPV